ncbi:DEAD/DEAH box helicase family protein [Parageobacillus toebii]|uniref:DEAD/DEAH box helicase family protein n=1 Tax=Parageobacillus toebii TaxID=153151 RepID=UPI002E1E108E|nr:DEAD/DEAH box helicase family protein [Parageobacillus toebii]
MSKVTVIDSIMGSGKTSWAKEYMNKNQKVKRFIYVSPYLDEIENNILKDCPFLVQPDEKRGKGSKLKHFKELLVNGESIVTTHALFTLFDNEVIELLKDAGYTLILDEVANVIEMLDKVTKHDIEILLNSNKIEVKDRKVIWLDESYDGVFDSRYANIKYHAQQGNLYLHKNSILFWTFPAKVFDLFEETYILTYLFDGQIQRYYYDLFNIEYTYKSVEKMGKGYCLVDYNPYTEGRRKYRSLINIYEGELNINYVKDGKVKGNELSSNWFRNADKKTLERLKKNLYAYFRKRGKSKDVIWTTMKEMRFKLRGKGYTKGFISLNTRATNKYQDTHNLAYVYNRYMNPIEKAFFDDAGVRVNEDLLAVSDLLQWIWRSAIRKHEPEPINIYIPSLRMRTLLYQWLNNEEVKFKK